MVLGPDLLGETTSYRIPPLTTIGDRQSRRQAWDILIHGPRITSTAALLLLTRDLRRVLGSYALARQRQETRIEPKAFNAWCKAIERHTRALIGLD